MFPDWQEVSISSSHPAEILQVKSNLSNNSIPMKKIIYTFCLIACLPLFSFSQKEANIWFFGTNAGLDFNSGSPVAITGGMINTHEGCASVCDANGDLLFYSDGITVWNKNHQVMPNGSGLSGDYSSTQSA